MLANEIIDCHCHAADDAMVESWRKSADYREASRYMAAGRSAGDPAPLVERMDRFGVDRACLAGSAIWSLDALLEPLRRYPARFAGFAAFREMFQGGERGAQLLEDALRMPEFLGVGEVQLFAFGKQTMGEVLTELRPLMEVARGHHSPVFFHTGAAPYAYHRLTMSDPVLLDDVARGFPDVPIIIGHMGVQGYYFNGYYSDMALLVAARHPNVYLDTSTAPPHLIERALREPALGAEKLLFGTDFPAPISFFDYKGRALPSYGKRPLDDFPNLHEASLGFIRGMEMSSDERALILGGNMAALLSQVKK